MSRGPGRIEQAIATAFERHPQRSFTTDELVAIAYPGVRRIAKKHRVAVLRAAKHVAGRYWRSALVMWGANYQLLFVNVLDETAWLRGYMRARLPRLWPRLAAGELERAAEVQAAMNKEREARLARLLSA